MWCLLRSFLFPNKYFDLPTALGRGCLLSGRQGRLFSVITASITMSYNYDNTQNTRPSHNHHILYVQHTRMLHPSVTKHQTPHPARSLSLTGGATLKQTLTENSPWYTSLLAQSRGCFKQKTIIWLAFLTQTLTLLPITNLPLTPQKQPGEEGAEVERENMAARIEVRCGTTLDKIITWYHCTSWKHKCSLSVTTSMRPGC